ncbi:GDSL-type esterase/lipase family protein [Leptospira wolffii]|uniref:GDSL-type esterase/lipase family protein n=1 Tax=Leptospira wolffii TaxID=409998 RepID=A0ABV5BQ04_9LEPT
MKKILGVSFLLWSAVSCSLFRANTIYDYYHPSFSCYSGIGIRDEDQWEIYQSKYKEAVEKYAAENAQIKKANIVFVGNSLMAAFPPAILSSEFSGAVNRGIPGDMTELLSGRLDRTVLNLKPSFIVLEIGGNDIREGKCLDYIEEMHKGIVRKIRTSLPNTKIVLLGIPPVLSKNVNSISPIANAWFAKIAAEDGNVQYLDIWPNFRRKDLPFIKEEFVPTYNGKQDPIHVNEEAYKVWAQKIKVLLK